MFSSIATALVMLTTPVPTQAIEAALECSFTNDVCEGYILIDTLPEYDLCVIRCPYPVNEYQLIPCSELD